MGNVISFIGGGNMGSAMIGGIISAGLSSKEEILVADQSERARQAAKDRFGVRVTDDNRKAAAEADILFLSIKPQFVYDVIKEIRESVSEKTLVISIVAGQKIASLEKAFGKPIRLIRVMPNTPALVGEAMSALSPNGQALKEDLEAATAIFDSFGKSAVVPERLMDAVTGVSGSSPAYVYMLIEAMADAAVADGMPRDLALTFAAQAVYGSAKMVLETGKHPGELKDMVCSPGGTTIEAVASLEADGFRGTVIKAQRACTEKSLQLGKDA